jgi:hypothetical protein
VALTRRLTSPVRQGLGGASEIEWYRFTADRGLIDAGSHFTDAEALGRGAEEY